MSEVNYDERRRVAKTFTKPSRTKQEPRDATNINNIIARWKKGHLPVGQRDAGVFMDCPAITFQEAMTLVKDAEDAFQRLPAKVRDAARNNPTTFLQMFHDPDERKVLEQAGLSLKREDLADVRMSTSLDRLSKAIEEGWKADGTPPEPPAEKAAQAKPEAAKD